MLKSKTALGIDISESRISLALLRQSAKGIELIKAANGPVPEGVIKDGSVEDPVKLYHAVKELRTRNKIRGINRAGVCLVTKPVIVQILDTPKGVPTNIGRFVRNEAKSCVALSGKEIAFDFCRLKSGQSQGGRLLVVATDGRKVAELAEACVRAGLNTEAIEPALLAYVRALHTKKVQGRFDCNVLIAVLRDGVLNLCVFKKQSLDFVAARNISREKAEPEELCSRLAEEINSIIRFYDIEAADSCGKWEVTVISDYLPLSDDAEQSLRAKIIVDSLQVGTGEDVLKEILPAKNNSPEKPSVVAFGLAMKFLSVNGDSLKINLIPPESAEVKSLKKHLLITANIIAAVILIMILVAGGLSRMANTVKQGIKQKKQTELSQETYNLLGERESLDKQIRQLSDRPARLKSILGSRYAADWARILEDVRNRTPKTVRITNLHSAGNTRIYLEGEALSYEVVHLFVKMLNESEYISLASLAETVREEKTGGLVMYSINCFLKREKKAG
jgi:Tfp pilus assembly protein PilN